MPSWREITAENNSLLLAKLAESFFDEKRVDPLCVLCITLCLC